MSATPQTDSKSDNGMIKVTIIEDMAGIRDGLRMLIDGTPGYKCAGTYRSMEDGLEGLRGNLPDVALVDIGLPGMSGIEGIRILTERYPGLAILMLTVYDDDERIFAAICAGASGYLLKGTPPARLLENIREARDGGAPLSPGVARRVLKLFKEGIPPSRMEDQLTPHEARLLKMLVDGHNYRTAAEELGVSLNTVNYHIKHIYEKLHVHSKSEAVSKALRLRIVK